MQLTLITAPLGPRAAGPLEVSMRVIFHVDEFAEALSKVASTRVAVIEGSLADAPPTGFIILFTGAGGELQSRPELGPRVVAAGIILGVALLQSEKYNLAAAMPEDLYSDWIFTGDGKSTLIGRRDVVDSMGLAIRSGYSSGRYGFIVNSAHKTLPELLVGYLTALEQAERSDAQLEVDERALGERARMLSSLADEQETRGQLEAALVSGAEAVRIYETLAPRDPGAYLPGLARTLNNLSGTQRSLGRLDEAHESAAGAVQLYQGLARLDPGAYLASFVAGLTNLGNIQCERGQMEVAVASAADAVVLRRDLVTWDRAAHLPGLAMSLSILASVQSSLMQREAALASVAEAVAIRRELARRNPGEHLGGLALDLNNLGIRQSECGQQEAALASVTEAAGILRTLAQEQPAAYLPKLAACLNTLGCRQRALGQQEAANLSFTESFDLFWSLYSAHPAAIARKLSIALRNLLKLRSDLGEAPDATLRERIEILRQQGVGVPDDSMTTFAPSPAGVD